MCVCEAIIQVLISKPDAKILVCAPSDAACDVLASRLLPVLSQTKAQKKLSLQPLIRLNWWFRKVASVAPSLLSVCPMDNHGAGLFTVPNLQTLTNVSVIICQCFVAECLDLVGRNGWTKKHFTHLFIDETSQAMECEALVPICKVCTEDFVAS